MGSRRPPDWLVDGSRAVSKIFDSDNDGFDREEFLLKTFFGLMLAQYIILAGQLGVCSWYGVYSMRTPGSDPTYADPNSATRVMCESMTTRLKDTFDLSVTTILALLGGAGLGTTMQQRRTAKNMPPVLHTTSLPVVKPDLAPPRVDDDGPDGGGIRMR